MPDSPPSPAAGLLAEALDHLAINGHDVTLDGDPLRYHIDGKPSIEGEIVALVQMTGTSQRMQAVMPDMQVKLVQAIKAHGWGPGGKPKGR